ncbi:hypothetical protein [Halobellus marinus]|uniref:hypothetical protein n=1 Tax=Halobellus TaxID=1073986 RepID=UPI0028AB1521|nr:hypothetical protein [Halobellus sp. DFY28]
MILFILLGVVVLFILLGVVLFVLFVLVVLFILLGVVLILPGVLFFLFVVLEKVQRRIEDSHVVWMTPRGLKLPAVRSLSIRKRDSRCPVCDRQQDKNQD